MMDRNTGRSLSGWPHVVQCLSVLLSTRLGEREMRRWVGSGVPMLLGTTATPARILQFFSAITIAIELYEPRFAVRQVRLLDLKRDGRAGVQIDGEYRPRGHLNDPTPESVRSFFIGPASG